MAGPRSFSAERDIDRLTKVSAPRWLILMTVFAFALQDLIASLASFFAVTFGGSHKRGDRVQSGRGNRWSRAT